VACLQQHPQNILNAHFGRYRDFGLYTDSLAFYGSRMFYYVWDVPIFCLMGAMGGFMGALWVHVNVKVTAFRHRFIPVRCAFFGSFSTCVTEQASLEV
jgi:chloride channel 7